MVGILSKINDGLNKIIEKRYDLGLTNDLDIAKLYINDSMYSLIENIPEAVPLNNSINISMELKSYNPRMNQNIEVELLAAGIKISGRRIQNEDVSSGKAIFHWNLNFISPGMHEILFIFREYGAGNKAKHDIYSRSIRVKSFISSYRDLSILLAIISALLTISTLIIKFFWGK
jgi:hypothetical protein